MMPTPINIHIIRKTTDKLVDVMFYYPDPTDTPEEHTLSINEAFKQWVRRNDLLEDNYCWIPTTNA